VSFELISGVVEARFGRGDTAVHDGAGVDFSEAHEHEVHEADGGTGSPGLNPETEEVDENDSYDEEDKDADHCED